MQTQAVVVVSSGSPCTKLFPRHGILQVKYARGENQIESASVFAWIEEEISRRLIIFIYILNTNIIVSNCNQGWRSALAERKHDGVNKTGRKVARLSGEQGGVLQLPASVR